MINLASKDMEMNIVASDTENAPPAAPPGVVSDIDIETDIWELKGQKSADVEDMYNDESGNDNELLHWLKGLKLDCYYERFVENGFDKNEMSSLIELNDEDLIAIGIQSSEHRE